MSASQTNPVVVGVDSSDVSFDAVRWAARQASRGRLPLTLVHAGYYLYQPALSEATASLAAREIDHHARELLGRAVTVAHEVDPSLRVHTELDSREPANALICLSEFASMVVVGTEGGASLAGLVLGSISQTVAAHARCPVVVLNRHAPMNAKPSHAIVVGVSPTEGGRQALRFAFEQASLRGCPVVAVRSWGDIGAGSLAMTDTDMLRALQAADARVTDECLAPLQSEFPEVVMTRRSAGTRAQWALEEAAIGADLLVVGCHRRDDHWFSRLGPVASWLLHRSPCPVAVVGRPHPHAAATQPSGSGQARQQVDAGAQT